MPISKTVGARIKRREDPRLIQGLAQYVDDIKLVDILHVAILRSPYAHARILSINTDTARSHPGVVAVVTGDDIKDKLGTVPCATTDPEGFPGMKVPPHYCLAVEKVRLVGEPVVAVVAEDKYIAQDALDLVEVDYDPLDAVTSSEDALAEGAPILHEQFGTNQAFTWSLAGGNIDAALAEADKVVKQKFVHQRLAP
ncbi:MAG TPA: carbon monoxide dehydrogenase, partial [Candidatus Latescibacteria bacterium]|nr:carbon monoxide dehydrogenase [Candidatus Latescibacterota bacterium]